MNKQPRGGDKNASLQYDSHSTDLLSLDGEEQTPGSSSSGAGKEQSSGRKTTTSTGRSFVRHSGIPSTRQPITVEPKNQWRSRPRRRVPSHSGRPTTERFSHRWGRQLAHRHNTPILKLVRSRGFRTTMLTTVNSGGTKGTDPFAWQESSAFGMIGCRGGIPGDRSREEGDPDPSRSWRRTKEDGTGRGFKSVGPCLEGGTRMMEGMERHHSLADNKTTIGIDTAAGKRPRTSTSSQRRRGLTRRKRSWGQPHGGSGNGQWFGQWGGGMHSSPSPPTGGWWLSNRGTWEWWEWPDTTTSSTTRGSSEDGEEHDHMDLMQREEAPPPHPQLRIQAMYKHWQKEQ